MDLLERLADKFLVGDGCWEWTAQCRNGYGRIRMGATKQTAHRVVYELMVGPIPAGNDLDHLCRNRKCVRPDHLEPVSHRVNVLRGEAPSAHHAVKTHCDAGHALTPDNVYERTDHVGRRCKECHRLAVKRYTTKIKNRKEAS